MCRKHLTYSLAVGLPQSGRDHWAHRPALNESFRFAIRALPVVHSRTSEGRGPTNVWCDYENQKTRCNVLAIVWILDTCMLGQCELCCHTGTTSGPVKCQLRSRLGEVQRTNRENLMLEMYLASHFGDHQPRQDHELTPYGSVHIHNFVTCYTRTMWKAVRRAKSSRSLQQLCLVGSLRTRYLPLSSSLSRLSKPRNNLHDTSSVSSPEAC